MIRRRLPPLRAALLEHWTTGGAGLGRLRRWLFEGLSRAIDAEYYAPSTTTAEREALKRLCMGAASGVRWAESYLARGFPDRYTPMLTMFAELETYLATGHVAAVHQVACCSGREIAYFARRYPHVAFVGSDGDAAVVAWLRQTWRAVPNLSFTRVRLELTEIAEADALRADLVYASGGLHYMDEPSVRHFVARVRERSPLLLVSQPLDRAFAIDGSARSRARGQLSWNHPYARYLREAGWRRVRWTEGVVEDLPWVKNVGAVASIV